MAVMAGMKPRQILAGMDHGAKWPAAGATVPKIRHAQDRNTAASIEYAGRLREPRTNLTTTGIGTAQYMGGRVLTLANCTPSAAR